MSQMKRSSMTALQDPLTTNVPGYGPVAVPDAVNLALTGSGARHGRTLVTWVLVAWSTSPSRGPPDAGHKSPARPALASPAPSRTGNDERFAWLEQPGSASAAQPITYNRTRGFMVAPTRTISQARAHAVLRTAMSSWRR